jgi:undecaprenyl-diphosphatase
LHAVLFSTVALSYYPQLAIVLVPFTVLIGLSRVVLGLHYPSDVFAGALIGSVVAGLSFLII